MARKYDLISELYNRTCKTVVSNPQNWQAFLASACRNYKLRYDEQLLVYAQRPDATAVLEIEQWNKIFGRWVNRGARGIAVFADENRSRQRLTHYFDISDTHESRYSRTVPIWDMRQEYEADVIETLESTFGEIENKSSLAEAIMGAARNAAEDNIPDYLQDLYYATEGSSFEEVEEDIVAFIYKNVVTNSVAYMMMSRLGVDTDGYFELDDFRDVTNFNTQETLNALGFAIFDYIEDDEGRKKAVLNKKETAIAQSKQEMIKQEFQDWIWSDPERRERLCKSYNEKFNSVRPREYDGSYIIFNGMNPEIELREHQKNAVAHILYGGNTLLAHAVGAGKTFEMVAAAQESKRLGLCNKSLFVVPNHLTEQWAAEYLQLYPAANILVATKKDFETKNRKKFCGRIATGDYDAVIIGHSQFEKIPMSIERQRAILEQQLEEITGGIAELKRNRGENFSIKQLEKSKKSIRQKLDKLNDQTKKDDVVTFEELGVDRLFVDESHYYKNLYLYTKMRNVGGIAQTEAQKSSDLFMKCRYLDEITGGRGTVFATGTPISNSMVELYTIQRYLQYNTLVKNNLQHFDSWASTFGETVTAVELTPEGYTLIGQKN